MRSAKETGCFPYRSKLVCFIELSEDGEIHQLKDIGDKRKAYALYKTAKSLYNESSEVSVDEFADPSLFGLDEFKIAVNAMLISRYGLSAVYLSHEEETDGISSSTRPQRKLLTNWA